MRCIRFDNKRIVSGAYDGSVFLSLSHTHTHKALFTETHFVPDVVSSHVSLYSKIKVWDLQAALDPRAPASTLCLRTLVVSVTELFAASHQAESESIAKRN